MFQHIFDFRLKTKIAVKYKSEIHLLAAVGLFVSQGWKAVELTQYSVIQGAMQALVFGPLTIMAGMLAVRVALEMIESLDEVNREMRSIRREIKAMRGQIGVIANRLPALNLPAFLTGLPRGVRPGRGGESKVVELSREEKAS